MPTCTQTLVQTYCILVKNVQGAQHVCMSDIMGPEKDALFF